MKLDFKRSLQVIIIYLVILSSCGKASPAGFWTYYRKDLLIKSQSDQGPYGGHRELYWKSNKKNTFASRDLIDFATRNGWQIADSIHIKAEILKKWMNDGETFPFTYSDFNDSSITRSKFPGWISSDVQLYRFKTGWIAVEPGNARETEKNGYIVINANGTELAVYHLWGE